MTGKRVIPILLVLMIVSELAILLFFTDIQSWKHSGLMFEIGFSTSWASAVAALRSYNWKRRRMRSGLHHAILAFVVTFILAEIVGRFGGWGGYFMGGTLLISYVFFFVTLVLMLIMLWRPESQVEEQD